ncbi:diphthine synthase [Thermogladius sp. 4427co]|uniref:diphthine synthase n=1 Tax=Thermogladius sp. 4427co TaxID=3450718 RepID=UPI003F78D839
MLLLIGVGMKPEDISIEALNEARNADILYFDTYTNYYEGLDRLREIIGRDFRLAKRKDLEGEGIRRILEEAKDLNVAILVPGDPIIATTHEALRVEALKNGIKVKLINGLSISTLAFSRTGLHFYKLGRTVTLTYYDSSSVDYVINVVYDNLERGLHTLILLDIQLEERKWMTIPEAVEVLLSHDTRGVLSDKIGVGLARLGLKDEFIIADLLPRLRDYEYPPIPHSLIIPASLHFMEVESLRYNCNLPLDLYTRLAR